MLGGHVIIIPRCLSGCFLKHKRIKSFKIQFTNSILTGHTFNSAVSVTGSQPLPVRILTGTLAKLKLVKTVPCGDLSVTRTFIVILPRRLDISTKSPSFSCHSIASLGLTSSVSSLSKQFFYTHASLDSENSSYKSHNQCGALA